MADAFTIVQVSDTHLSETHAYFIDNFRVFAEEMALLKPDLIVHTGDISFNGPARPADLDFAMAQLSRLPARLRIVAGNHDIGEAPRHSRLYQPLTDQRVAAWEERIGPLFWVENIGLWRLIGLDSALLASDRVEEKEQWTFLEAALSERKGQPAMVVMHLPPFEKDPADPKFTTSSVPFEARGRLLDLLAKHRIKVLACGHLHVYRRLRHRGIEIVWAPTTAMVHIERQWKKWRRWARPGYLVWRIEGRRIRHALIEPRLMIAQDPTRWTEVSGTTTNLPPRPLIVPT